MKKSSLAILLFSILPIAYIAPPLGSLFGIRILLIDILCWLGLIFLHKNFWKAKNLLIWLLLIVTITIISNLWGMIIIGYGFNLKNFTIIKYLVSYLGAIAIGVNVPTKDILKSKFAIFSLIALFIMSLLTLLSPKYGMIISNFYGQSSTVGLSGRLLFLDPNPNMVGQIGTILTILSVISLKKSQLNVALAFIAGAMIIFLTTSRLNLLTLSVFIVFYYLIISKKSSWKGMVLITATGLIMFTSYNFYANDKYFQERIMRITNIKSAVEGRIYVFEGAVENFFLSPIIGTGYKKSTQRGNKKFNYSLGGASEVHSQWLGFLFNHGIIGFLILFGFFIAIGRKLRGLFKIYKNDAERYQVVKVLFVLYLIYFFSMLGWETFYLPHYSLLFFIFFGKLYQLKYEKYSFIKSF